MVRVKKVYSNAELKSIDSHTWVKSTEKAESSTREAATPKDKSTKEKHNQQKALALAEGAGEKIEPPDVSKIVNGVKKLKVEASITRARDTTFM